MKYATYEKYRNQLNLMDSQVSKMTGVSTQSLSQWKLRQTKLKLETQILLAEKLGIPKKYWLEKEEINDCQASS